MAYKKGKGTSGKKESKEGEECKVCQLTSGDDERWVQCDICEGWNHALCAGLDDKEYEVLKKGGRKVKWLCKECDLPTVIEMIKMFKDNKTKNEQIEKDLSIVKVEVANVAKKLNDEIGAVNKKLSDNKMKIDKHIESVRDDMVKLVEKKIAEKMKETDDNLVKTVKSKVEDHLQTVTNNIADVSKSLVDVKRDVDEQKEREQRAANIIMYNVPESSSEQPEDRNLDDQQFCLDTFNKVLKVKINAADMKKMVRLGKRVDSVNRPLLIQFRDRVLKNMIMESLSVLKEAGETHRKLIFAHDLTKKEREVCKTMVAEAKEQETNDTSGEFLYRVRGVPGSFRIVKIKRR